MNPLIEKQAVHVVAVLLSSALIPAGEWLARHGYMQEGDIQFAIYYLATVVVVAGYAAYKARKEHGKLMIAAATHAVLSENDIEDIAKSGAPLPDLKTPKHVIPSMPPSPSTPATFGR